MHSYQSISVEVWSVLPCTGGWGPTATSTFQDAHAQEGAKQRRKGGGWERRVVAGGDLGGTHPLQPAYLLLVANTQLNDLLDEPGQSWRAQITRGSFKALSSG